MTPRVALLAVTCTSCGGRPEILEQPLSVGVAQALDRDLAFLDQTRERLVLVDPGSPPRVRHLETGHRPATLLPTIDRRGVIVLSRGLESTDPDFADQEPRLTNFDAETGDAAVYPLTSPFDRVTLSEDGRYALAFFGEEPAEEGLFRNPNEVALIDLEVGPDDENPAVRTIRAFGQAPKGAVFSPPLCIPAKGCAETRTLAVVLASGSLTFLDATHPGRREITVQLQIPGAQAIEPEEVVFAPEQGTVFVRAADLDDIFVIALLASTPEGEDGNDYHPALSQLAAGRGPSDIDHYDEGGARKVLAVNTASRDVSIIDAATSTFVNIPVGDSVDRALLFPPDAPTAALLFARGNAVSRIYFLDLMGLEDERGRNLTHVDLGSTAADVQLVDGGTRALVLHDEGRTVVSVVDLGARTVFPLQGNLALTSYDFAEGGRYLVAVADGLDRIGVVDLTTLHPSEVRLDRVPVRVLALPGSGAVVVEHGSLWGELTVLPSPRSTRDEAFVVEGFLLEGIAEGGLRGVPVEQP